MEIQELKRLLQSVSIKQSQINELAARRGELLASAAAPGCGCYENIAGSGKAYRSDKIGSAIAKAAAIDEQLAAVFDEYKAAFKTVRELTGRCNDGICIALLRRRYLCGKTGQKFPLLWELLKVMQCVCIKRRWNIWRRMLNRTKNVLKKLKTV